MIKLNVRRSVIRGGQAESICGVRIDGEFSHKVRVSHGSPDLLFGVALDAVIEAAEVFMQEEIDRLTTERETETARVVDVTQRIFALSPINTRAVVRKLVRKIPEEEVEDILHGFDN